MHLPVNSVECQALFLYVSCSITIPEKLEYFINKYAEHSHDKWSMDKVKVKSAVFPGYHCECLDATPIYPTMPTFSLCVCVVYMFVYACLFIYMCACSDQT